MRAYTLLLLSSHPASTNCMGPSVTCEPCRPPRTEASYAQGELKLCSYTLESCAAAVLQRRVPRIPHVHLVRWFNDGPAGASVMIHMRKRAVTHDMHGTTMGCDSSRRHRQMTALSVDGCCGFGRDKRGASHG